MEQAAIEAANWWATAIGAPTFDTGEAIASALGSGLADRHTATPAQQEDFAELLAASIDESLDHYGLALSVDYGPDHRLGRIAEACGVSVSRFPWKTHMWVRMDHVVVSSGYAAPDELVWASEEWKAADHRCDSQQWDVEARKGAPWKCGLPLYHPGSHDYSTYLPVCHCGRPQDRHEWHGLIGHDYEEAPLPDRKD